MIKRIINNRWEILQQEPDFHGLFEQKTLFAYKRSHNLKEILSKKSQLTNQKYEGTKKCLNCIHCNNVTLGNTHTPTNRKSNQAITFSGLQLQQSDLCH